MQIVIDIDEYEYKKAKELVLSGLFEYEGTTAHLFKRVANGTPLPKGHGDLKDATDLLKMTESYKSELGRLKADPFVKSGIETVESFIKEMQTIIEAESEVEEE